MNQIKHINTEKVTLLAVMVPEGAKEHDVCGSDFRSWYYQGRHLTSIKTLELPVGNWQILGISTELTEEQWREIIPHKIARFIKYPITIPNRFYETAKESGLSLLEANRCYSVNPYEEKWSDIQHLYDTGECEYSDLDEIYSLYSNNQANTGTWLILNPI